jgi:hypothetical protein
MTEEARPEVVHLALERTDAMVIDGAIMSLLTNLQRIITDAEKSDTDAMVIDGAIMSLLTNLQRIITDAEKSDPFLGSTLDQRLKPEVDNLKRLHRIVADGLFPQ